MIPGTENRGTENHARPPRGEDDVPEGHEVHARSACGMTEMSCALDGVEGDFRRVADETRERRGPQLPRARVPGAHAPNSCTDCDSHTRRITYNAEQTEANVKFTIILG